ncbi:KdsC family phosphatase [Glaciimonas soli]|nr:HAD-IIIA family hydrolase [Glaciimonas soli]
MTASMTISGNANHQPSAEVLARAAKVQLMIFDVDGVLTDGSLYFDADGEQVKRFNVLDGLGIKLLQKMGIATAIITARSSPIVRRRAEDLGITHVFQGALEKHLALAELLAQLNLSEDACGYIGDDVIDLPILTRAGFAVSVPNGHPEATSRVHYVTHALGGNGAVREVCDLVLRAQNKYEAAIASYLNNSVGL